MFKVLIGGRQNGATTKIIEMIEEDINNKLSVGVFGKSAEFKRIKNKIKNPKVNKYLFNITSYDGYNYDKIYLLNILDMDENILDNLYCSHKKDIFCDKPMPTPLFNKIEFDLAKEYRYKDSIEIDDLKEFIKLGVDINLMLKYINSPLTRKDIEFIRCESTFGSLKRLVCIKNNPNYYCDVTGIMFK